MSSLNNNTQQIINNFKRQIEIQIDLLTKDLSEYQNEIQNKIQNKIQKEVNNNNTFTKIKKEDYIELKKITDLKIEGKAVFRQNYKTESESGCFARLYLNHKFSSGLKNIYIDIKIKNLTSYNKPSILDDDNLKNLKNNIFKSVYLTEVEYIKNKNKIVGIGILKNTQNNKRSSFVEITKKNINFENLNKTKELMKKKINSEIKKDFSKFKKIFLPNENLINKWKSEKINQIDKLEEGNVLLLKLSEVLQTNKSIIGYFNYDDNKHLLNHPFFKKIEKDFINNEEGKNNLTIMISNHNFNQNIPIFPKNTNLTKKLEYLQELKEKYFFVRIMKGGLNDYIPSENVNKIYVTMWNVDQENPFQYLVGKPIENKNDTINKKLKIISKFKNMDQYLKNEKERVINKNSFHVLENSNI